MTRNTTKQKMHRLLLIGPRLGDTPTGVSVAFEALVSSIAAGSGTKPFVVDTCLASQLTRTGLFSLAKAWFTIVQCCRSVRLAATCSQTYLIISSSRWGFLKDFFVIWSCWFLRCPVITHLHGGGYRTFLKGLSSPERFVVHQTLNRVAEVIVLGEALKSQFDFLPPEKVTVVPNGVSAHRQEEGTLRTLPRGRGPLKLLFMSNLMTSKGYLSVAEAAAEIRAGNEFPIEVNFCGSFLYSRIEGNRQTCEDHRNRFNELLRDPELKQVLKFHGPVKGDLKHRLLAEAHALILPTKYPGEGQPLCILEAMSAELPVIATDHAGIREQLKDGVTGLRLDTETTSGVKNAIRSLRSLSEFEYRQMCISARQHFEQRFTISRHLQRMHEVLGIDSGDSGQSATLQRDAAA